MTLRLPLLIITVICALLLLPTLPHDTAHASTLQTQLGQRSGFPVKLDSGRIKFGSVTLADLDGDGKQEILVGSESGILYVLNQNGSRRWSFNVGAAINAAASKAGLAVTSNPTSIRSAPAAANITGDSRLEVIVSAGDVTSVKAHGGVVALSPDGALLSGWPQLPLNIYDVDEGFTEGVVTSPAVGDITGDGVPEIIYGAFDQRIYAKQVNGNNVPGWPKFALDTIWSSPALADLNGDKVNDVIIGVDSHNYSGNEGTTVDGGYLYALKGDGTTIWSKNQDEIFESSPAVADLDGDGLPEIAIGTGTYYGDIGHTNAQGVRVGQYLTVWNNDGSILWRVNLPDRVVGAPAIGDVTGDSGPEVVVGAFDGKMYAFDGKTGAIRWSTQGHDIFNNAFRPGSPVLGDFTGDGRDDVFAGLGWEVTVFRGTDGVQLTATSNTDPSKPSFYGNYTIDGTPAVGDLDGNGKLDLVSASGMSLENRAQVNSWALSSSTAKASWPMFRREPSHRAYAIDPKLQVSSNVSVLIDSSQTRNISLAVTANDSRAINWSIKNENDPHGIVQVTTPSGTALTPLQLTVDPGAATAAVTSGVYTAILTVGTSGLPDVTITINVLVASQVTTVSLPLVVR